MSLRDNNPDQPRRHLSGTTAGRERSTGPMREKRIGGPAVPLVRAIAEMVFRAVIGRCALDLFDSLVSGGVPLAPVRDRPFRTCLGLDVE